MTGEIQRNTFASSTLGGLWSLANETPKRLWHYWTNSTNSPSALLRRIDETADRGIRKAKTAGLPVPNIYSQVNIALDRSLKQYARRGSDQEIDDEVPPALGPMEPDAEITPALQLQDRVDQTNWKQKQSEYQKKLTEKLNVFGTFFLMRNYAGLDSADNLKILNLVKQATEGPQSRSVWQLFSENYEMSFFQKLCAAFCYVFFYKTSLVHNTIDAYLDAFLKSITSNLSIEGNDTRTKVFRGLIENANEFLLEDLHATKAFANEQRSGLLKNLRDKAIENHYGSSLTNLANKFSESIVATDPRVKILHHFHKIPIMGYIFQLFEWAVNKVIIQQMMKNLILPKSLESVVTKGLEATQPDKLPFAISLTQFFTAQLEQFRVKIETPFDAFATETVAGTEQLPSTIKYLLKALALEGEFTPQELRELIAKTEQPGFIDKTVEKDIENGVLKGGKALFSYLSETIQSGELFAKLLELSLVPLGGEQKSEEQLRREFEEEKLKFDRTASSVFETVVKKTIFGELDPVSDPQKAQKMSQEAYENQAILASSLINMMGDISQRIMPNIIASNTNPTQAQNIHTDILELLQITKMFDSREEFQNNLEMIDSTNRKEIWIKFTPIFEEIELLQTSLLSLQDAVDQYPRHADLVFRFEELKTKLTTIQDQFHTQPRHLQTPLLQQLRSTYDEISKTLGSEAPIPRRLLVIIEEISNLSSAVTKEQNTIDAVCALYPSREDDNDPRAVGLLDQLRNYQRGVQIQGFKPRDCMQSIAKYLNYFSPNDKRELERIIGNGTDIESKWPQLGFVLQRVYDQHMRQKLQHSEAFDHALNIAKSWIDNKHSGYSDLKRKDYEKMTGETNKILLSMQSLHCNLPSTSHHLSIPISDRLTKVASFTLPALGLAAAVNPWVSIPTSLTLLLSSSSLLPGVLYGNESKSPKNLKKSLGNIAFSLAGGIGSSFAYGHDWLKLGAAGLSASGFFAGHTGTKAVKAYKVHRGFNAVWEKFTQAYSFSMNPRVYKAATTRFMKAWVDG